MSSTFDNLLAYKILSLLVQPFNETDAYKLGIIDDKGKNLISSAKFTKQEQKDAYNYLTKLVFNLKKMINRVPGGESKLKNIMAGYFLVKECIEKEDLSFITEENFMNLVDFYEHNTPLEERLMYEEVVANNTANVSGLKKDDVAVKLKPKSILRRNKPIL